MVLGHYDASVLWYNLLFRDACSESLLGFVEDCALVHVVASVHVLDPLDSCPSVTAWCLVPRVLDQVESELLRIALEVAIFGGAVVRVVAWALIVDEQCDGDPVV